MMRAFRSRARAMRWTSTELGELVCPSCRGSLSLDSVGSPLPSHIERGALGCDTCGARWPIERGLPRMYREHQIRGNDRLLRYFYDGLPALHDPAVRFALPICGSGTERRMREGYARRFELEALDPRPTGAPPIRILEVGVGTGANLGLIRRGLRPGARAEIWGLDLSEGMLAICQKRLEAGGHTDTRLVIGDAHQLPFRDHYFDRVFHIGALNSFSDPARALAEMARTAMPGTPVVVVDERLDPEAPQSLYHRAMFRLVTFYDPDPHCPREHLPAGAIEVREEQLNRFFYCMTFRVAS